MIKRYIQTLDYKLLVAIVLLCTIGAIMVYSSSSIVAVMRFARDDEYFFRNQVSAMLGGGILFFIFSLLPYQILKKRIFVLGNVVLCYLLLISVLVFGDSRNAAQAWINIGGFQFQPTEFIKIAIVVMLASTYAKQQMAINRFWKVVFPPLLHVIAIFALVFLQNDLGSGLIIIGMVAFMIVGIGMKPRKTVKIAILGVISAILLGIIAYFFVLKPYQISRFTAFLDPFSIVEGGGYQPINAYMAMINGGIFGSGLGNSLQKYGRLPEAYTDYIIAIIAEELGFFGVFVILAGIAFIVFRGLIIAKRCPDPFGSLVAIGISAFLGVQTFVNIGGVTGIIPMTGVPLPFISFGGTSIAATLFGMGILMSISRYNKSLLTKGQEKKEKPNLTVVK